MLKVWIVDDDAFIAELMAQQLKKECNEVTEITAYNDARNAMLALQQATGPDVLILDLQMPEMDGVSVIRKLKALNFGGQLILCSGEDERLIGAAEQVATIHKLKVLGSLRKPPKAGQLRALVERSAVLDNDIKSSLVNVSELKRALENHEFVNYYQPKVQLSNGAHTGAEVLVRWLKPNGQICFPDQFIPVAEASGLMPAIDHEVFNNASRDLNSWQTNQPMGLAFNLSAKSLTDVNIPDELQTWCRLTGIAASMVTIELTESQLVKDKAMSLDILIRLRLLGFTLSIDDFGTGYSSLDQLRNIPFNELKIDKSFTRDVSEHRSQQAILRSSAALAKDLSMRTVVEGVESQQDWNFARELGCDLAQGYFIAKPMDATTYRRWWLEKSVISDASVSEFDA